VTAQKKENQPRGAGVFDERRDGLAVFARSSVSETAKSSGFLRAVSDLALFDFEQAQTKAAPPGTQKTWFHNKFW